MQQDMMMPSMYHNPQQEQNQQNFNFQMGVQSTLPPSPVNSVLLPSPSSSVDDHCDPIHRGSQHRMSQQQGLTIGFSDQ